VRWDNNVGLEGSSEEVKGREFYSHSKSANSGTMSQTMRTGGYVHTAESKNQWNISSPNATHLEEPKYRNSQTNSGTKGQTPKSQRITEPYWDAAYPTSPKTTADLTKA
jgi:hypothetical protein